MTYDVSEVFSENSSMKMIHSKHQQSVHQQHQQQNMRKSVGVMGTRRIFTTAFKIKVLDSYRHDKDCRQNQRATARKYGIHRRQIQKWLQCEEQLRNSFETLCSKYENTAAASSTTISSTAVSKSDGTVTEATGSTVTPAAPALNLNLARQHGDELTTQQGPPPPSHGSAPSSPQYSLQTTTTGTTLPLCVASVSYQEYSSEQQRLCLELEDRVHIPEIHGYPDTQTDQDRNYYVLNGDGHRDAETASVFGGRNDVKVYQTLISYHSPHQEHRYGVNDINDINSSHNNSPNHPQQREQNYGSVDSYDGRPYGLLLAPSMIKTEPASPDTAATSGPYEPTSSPGGPRAPLSPVSHRVADSCGSSSSVHFVDPSRTPASPYLHVHAHEHAHTCPPLDSEKPIPSLLHQQERESEETTRHTEEKREDEMLRKADYCRTMIKEEVHFDEEEIYDEREEATLSIDYQRPPAGESSLGSSGSVSPVYDRKGYSLPSSPHDSTSTGKSKSSWSDSEIDPLASTSNLNSSGNFIRRRSFPLRFKLDVLDAFHHDEEVKENQRATARKFGINRRQVQKWLEQETELRDEIALRGESRQRLGPVQDVVSGDSPLDLTTTNYVSNCVSLLRDRLEMEHEQSSPHFYRCDVDSVSTHPSYFQHSAGIEPSSEIEAVGPCNLSCSVDSHTTTSTSSSYQELSLRESCYTESSIKTYCHSPRANSEVSNISEGCEQRFSPLKRQRCTLSCCYDATPLPKRFCEKFLDADDSYDAPQDTPLCLVKPKSIREVSPSRMELITIPISTVPTSNNPDAITFKPYLDNPVSKPAKKCAVQRDLSPISNYNVNNNSNNNNNNNCQIICNFNEDQNRNYDFELNFRVPLTWTPGLGIYSGIPHGTALVSVASHYM